MIRRNYNRRSRRLNENASCPALNWKVDKYREFREDTHADPTLDGKQFFFAAWLPYTEYEDYRHNSDPVVVTNLDDPYHDVVLMNAGVGSLTDEVHHDIHGTLDDGKRICEELWRAVCAASEFCDINEEVFMAIARKQGWNVN